MQIIVRFRIVLAVYLHQIERSPPHILAYFISAKSVCAGLAFQMARFVTVVL